MVNIALTSTKIDFNPQFKHALDILENSTQHVFITGRAGTGKSTLLDYFRTQTKKKQVVLAPTGVAALNVDGQTIHSFFKFIPNITLKEARAKAKKEKRRLKLFQNLEMLIIDEISMVRADLLDCMDQFLRVVRKNPSPFGGVRLICFGDLYQLPPVARGQELNDLKKVYDSIYFFSAKVFQELLQSQPVALKFIELEKIYRQTEQAFISFLNSIRDKTITDEQLTKLNQRVLIDLSLDSLPARVVVLTAMNKQARDINLAKLTELHSSKQTFEGQTSGTFRRSSFPTDEILELKVGARVMMVNNDRDKRWVNGSMAIIKDFINEEDIISGVLIQLDDGAMAEVYPNTWEISQAYFDQSSKSIQREVMGSFSQIPMRLAWAITIHKSQGKTFDQVVVDLGRGAFATGQTYVALSRCSSFAGLHLAKPLKKSDVRLDYAVVKFLTSLAYQLADEKQSGLDKRGLLETAIKEKRQIKIVYLKGKNIKSKRIITPNKIEKMVYAGHDFVGLEAFCHLRKADRIFNLKRILEVEEVEIK